MKGEKLQEHVLRGTQEQNFIIFKELIGFAKLKNTWIAQIVTVAGTLIGGLTLFSPEKNIVAAFGLVILFGTIIFGLILMIHNLNKETNRLIETFKSLNEISVLTYEIIRIEEIETPSTNDLRQKKEFGQRLNRHCKKMNVLDKNGNINFYNGIALSKVASGNYILIFGLAIGALCITLSKEIFNLLPILLSYIE